MMSFISFFPAVDRQDLILLPGRNGLAFFLFCGSGAGLGIGRMGDV